MYSKTQYMVFLYLTHCLWLLLQPTMPGEATETVPVTEQEMQQPQVETGL